MGSGGSRNACDLARERERVEELFVIEEEARTRGHCPDRGRGRGRAGLSRGPVYAGAVVFDRRVTLPGLDDSKALLPEVREALASRIRAVALGAAVGAATAAEIDAIGIVAATLPRDAPCSRALARRGTPSRRSSSSTPCTCRDSRSAAAGLHPRRRARGGDRGRLDRGEGGARRPHGRAREAFSVLRFRITSGIRDPRAHFRAAASWSLAGAPVDVRPRSGPPRRARRRRSLIMASKRDALVASAEKSLAKGKVDCRAEGLPEGPRGDSRRRQHPEQGR